MKSLKTKDKKRNTLAGELPRRDLDRADEEKTLPKSFSLKPFKSARIRGVTDEQIEEMLKEI